MKVNWLQDVTDVVTVASVMHMFLPPWDAFSDFPRFQKYYKVGVYVIGYVALNGRSTVYKSISTSNPKWKDVEGQTNGAN